MTRVSTDELIALDGFTAPAFLPDGSALLCLGPGDGEIGRAHV